MTVRGDDAKLPHPPRFVAQGFANPGTRGANRLVQRIHILELEIGKVAMIPELGRRNRIRALPRHDRAVATAVEMPTGIRDRLDLEAEHVAIKRRRLP